MIILSLVLVRILNAKPFTLEIKKKEMNKQQKERKKEATKLSMFSIHILSSILSTLL